MNTNRINEHHGNFVQLLCHELQDLHLTRWQANVDGVVTSSKAYLKYLGIPVSAFKSILTSKDLVLLSVQGGVVPASNKGETDTALQIIMLCGDIELLGALAKVVYLFVQIPVSSQPRWIFASGKRSAISARIYCWLVSPLFMLALSLAK